VSQADVDVVLDQFDAVNQRDFERAMNGYAEDVILVVSENTGPYPGMHEGKKAVGEWFGDWFRTFDRNYRFDIEEVRELPEGLIFLFARHGGSGRLSGAQVRGEHAYLYRVRDGKVSRVGFFPTKSEALEAASLPEWSQPKTD